MALTAAPALATPERTINTSCARSTTSPSTPMGLPRCSHVSGDSPIPPLFHRRNGPVLRIAGSRINQDGFAGINGCKTSADCALAPSTGNGPRPNTPNLKLPICAAVSLFDRA